MDVIIVTHTEFGFVNNKRIIHSKNAIDGVKKGVSNLVKIADRYNAGLTFAVMPEVAKYFPKDVSHEIGLHIHAGWEEFNLGDFKFHVGDEYLREHSRQSLTSTVLRDYPYEEQLDLIKTGKDYLTDIFGIEPKTFVAGRWSINNDTVKALIKIGLTRDCSAPPHSRPCHYEWSKLPRICMPYHPSPEDYQEKGNLSLLMIPISQTLFAGIVTPEFIPVYGLSWLKACFLEYYKQNIPIFHICLHSPCMTDPYFILEMDNLLKFISKHKNINFKFASEIMEYENVSYRTDFVPYIFGFNWKIAKLGIKAIKSRMNF
jgi:peptidoglycan/xylan/chitin deacetylase (PgdA/CDA1 family)